MKLNTLKDIMPINMTDRELFTKKLLKQEAVKWIKSNNPMLNDNDGAVENWIKHFFNITEEDLE